MLRKFCKHNEDLILFFTAIHFWRKSPISSILGGNQSWKNWRITSYFIHRNDSMYQFKLVKISMRYHMTFELHQREGQQMEMNFTLMLDQWNLDMSGQSGIDRVTKIFFHMYQQLTVASAMSIHTGCTVCKRNHIFLNCSMLWHHNSRTNA